MESPAAPSGSAPENGAFFDSPEFREQLEQAIEASGLSTEPSAATANVLRCLSDAAANDGSPIWQHPEVGIVVLALARAGGLSLGVAEGITTAVENATVDETVETVAADEELVAGDENTEPLPPRQGDDPVTRAMDNARNEVRAPRRGSASL